MNRFNFFTKEENEMRKLISFTDKVLLLGSQNNPKMLDTTDYDFMEILTPRTMKTTEIVKLMKNKVKKIRNMDNVYLGDVKAGEFKGEKLRWSGDEIIQGFKKIENQIIQLREAINQKDTDFKIDMIMFLDTTGRYHEMSNVIMRKKPPSSTSNNIRQELLKEVKEKKREGKIYKSIKRLYSFLATYKGREKEKEELLDIINNPILGALHQMNEGLNTLIFLMENNRVSVRNEEFKRELQGFKQWLWITYGELLEVKPILEELKNIIEKPTLEKIKSYQQKIEVILNENTNKKLKNLD
jgi:hypothetical protein